MLQIRPICSYELMTFILHLKVFKDGSKMVLFYFFDPYSRLVNNFVTNFLSFSHTKKAWEMTKPNWKRLEIKSKHAKLFYNNWEIILSWVRTWEFVKYLLTKVAQLASTFGGFIYTFSLSSSSKFQSSKFTSSSICN